MLGALEGRGARSERSGDEHLPAAAGSRLHAFPAGADGLKGARIGIPRAFFYDSTPSRLNGAARRTQRRSGEADGGGHRRPQARRRGRRRPRRHPEHRRQGPDSRTSLLWAICSGADRRAGQGRELLDRLQVRHEARLQHVAGVARAVGAGQDAHRAARSGTSRTQNAGAIKYGQAKLDISDEMDVEKDRARYEADRAKDIRLAATHGIDEVMKAQKLDALLFPGGSGAGIAARPGYPTVIVPFGVDSERTDAAAPPTASTRSRRPTASASPASPAASRGSSRSRTRSSRRANVEFPRISASRQQRLRPC